VEQRSKNFTDATNWCETVIALVLSGKALLTERKENVQTSLIKTKGWQHLNFRKFAHLYKTG